MQQRRWPIGGILVEEGRINLQQLRVGLSWQRRWGGKLGRALLMLGYLDEPVLFAALGRQLGIPTVELTGREVPPEVMLLVPERVLRERRVLPIALLAESRRGPLLVATSDPLDVEALDEVAFASGKAVRPVLATPLDVDRALARHLDGWRFRAPMDVPLEPCGPLELVDLAEGSML